MKVWPFKHRSIAQGLQPTIKQSILSTAFAQILFMPLGFIAKVFAARYLGLSGQGQPTLITTTIQTVAILGGLITGGNDILQGEK